ncbi:MAG TPA: hypothetical protein VFT67_02175 [Jatrophihabitantaceae bacterium]|jgi:hypothetical protein|nr:hypothetical protein [Jatrophihabitantaceae bacterium]
MTLNLWSRGTRQFCAPADHSWIVQQFRGTRGVRNLRICERCGRTHVVLAVERETAREPVHAAASVAA